MPQKRREAPLGATDGPDVADDYLVDWEPGPLTRGFVIEDARLDATAGLAGADAALGRIALSTLQGAALAGVRLRSLRAVDVIARDLDASNADLTGAHLNRVVFERCRMTGLRIAF